jgi:hypothetical protein
MPTQDTTQLKERIITIIKTIGPSIPSYISSQINMSILFTSAFLSELLSEKRLKISHMRIGSSPIYFIPGQENELEKYSIHLKSREKDAFILLKDRKFLKDSEQEPAIRVALRSIRDFAIPLKISEEIYWKFLTVNEEEFYQKKNHTEKEIKEDLQKVKHEKKTPEEILKEDEKIKEKLENEEEHLEKEHFKKEDLSRSEKSLKTKKTKEKDKKIKTKKKPLSQKTNENFFNKIKEYLAKKEIEILDIVNFSKDEAILKTKKNNYEEMIFAFNKKKISEKEIMKAFKKSSESGLNYSILFLGETPKKINDIIAAVKKLSNIHKIED